MSLSIQERLKDLRVERGLDAGAACGADTISPSLRWAVMKRIDFKDISHYALIRAGEVLRCDR